MPRSESTGSTIRLSVENVGGIDETAIEFEPGVTVLTGRNATNRTSFLRALMAAVGSDDAALKADATAGSVELHVDGERHTRTLSRRQGTDVFDGAPMLDDPQVADLFAFLLESNAARRAVERGEDLYDVIMRPVDTDEIDAEIRRLEQRREELAAELEDLEALESTLPDLEGDRTTLAAELEEMSEALAAKQAELESLRDEREDPRALPEPLEELRETRQELESVRRSRSEAERVVEALRADRDEIEAQLEGLAAVEPDELAQLEETISSHRERVEAIETTVSELQSVIQFNESFLDGAHGGLAGVLDDGDNGSGGAVTDQLVEDGSEVVCWTCGSQVHSDHVEATLERLRSIRSDKVEVRSELRAEIDELEAERKHIERTIEEHQRLQQERSTVESDLEAKAEQLEALESDAAELEAQVEELEAAVDELGTDGEDEYLAVHREVNELEFERDRLQSELESVESELESVETRLAERDELEAERARVDDEIEDLRSRIEQLEADVVDHFNDEMAELLERLEFENLERVWIEPVHGAEPTGRGAGSNTTFDLHIVRTNASGSVYEDSIEHLSESEREVVGIVFALSGYLVHEVYDEVPFMLLDSLEALDAERIATLVDYVAGYAPNLVVALLPEDAQSVDNRYERVTEV